MKKYLVTFIYQTEVEAPNQFHAAALAQLIVDQETPDAEIVEALVVERVEQVEDDDDDSN